MTVIERRRAWATAYIHDARGRGHVPPYGTPKWHQLDAADPLRWAAVIIAAECWASDGDDIPTRMRRDLADQAHAEWDLLVDDELHAEDRFAVVAAQARALARRPSYAELQHRRGELTDDQLADWQRAHTAFVGGYTDHPAHVPTAQEPPR